MKQLLENRFWDWISKSQDLPFDESDKQIFLICLGMIVLLIISWVIFA